MASQIRITTVKTLLHRGLAMLLAYSCSLGLGATAPALAATASPSPSPSPMVHTNLSMKDEIRITYGHLANDYYKKVAPQVLLTGAHDGMITYLKYRGVSHPALPTLTAVDSDVININHLAGLLDLADARYGKRVAKVQLLYAELAGLAESVHDRYTLFLTPSAKEMLNESLDGGNFSGVGLSIDVDPITHYLRVNEVIPGGPAMHAGVMDNDVITEIDGISTRGLSTLADSKKLRGKVGTRVRLTIRRNGTQLAQPIVVTRAVIHDPSVVAKMLPGHIGYIRLSVFGSTTGKETATLIKRLDAAGAQAYILDLRDNGGGYLTAAIDVASNFVPNGGIVSVEDRSGSNTQYNAQDTALRLRPLVVLVNRSTASASEITAGAIQDHTVGVLIGTRTFGKGVVQTIYPFADGSAIKVTTQHYYTPRGRDINKVGIQPNIFSASSAHVRYGDLAKDTQLKAGLQYIRDEMARNKSEDQ